METHAPRLILVPTDFSVPAAHALRYAAALGDRFGAHLLVIYADPFAAPVDYTLSGAVTSEALREDRIEAAREELQAFAETNIGPAVAYDVRVVTEPPVDGILGQIRESGADLVVMGTHGRTGLRRILFGSVTEAIMRLAPVPVIAANESTSERAGAKMVLARVTFTPECRAALRYAAVLSGDDTRFVLFRAVEIAGRYVTVDDINSVDVWTPADLRDRSALRVVQSADAADIVEAARREGAQMIALGISGDRGIADDFRGTVAERVVQHSRCPVLSVNTFTARALLGESSRTEALATA